MASKIYKSDVRTAPDCCGEYVEVTRRGGRIVARTIQLFTHGPDRIEKWRPATEYDIDRARAPMAWLDEAARANW